MLLLDGMETVHSVQVTPLRTAASSP